VVGFSHGETVSQDPWEVDTVVHPKDKQPPSQVPPQPSVLARGHDMRAMHFADE
jgi:hypothetical protein